MQEIFTLLTFCGEEDEFDMLLMAYCNHYILNARLPLAKLTIDSFCELEFVKVFRFTKGDFGRLLALLQFSDRVDVGSRYNVSGEECLLVLLGRLVYPGRLCQLARFFNRSKSALSIIFNYALDHVHGRTKHLLTFDTQRLNPSYLERMAEINRRKCPLLGNCIGYIDGTVRPICRPTQDQRLFYNGHKRVHALKFHSILLPDGIIAYMDGPYHGRDHDAGLLHRSGLDAILARSLLVGDRQYHIYGDSGYPRRPYLLRPHAGSSLTRQESVFNARASQLRVSVEWSFGKIASLFAFVDFKKNAKIRLQPVGKYYIVATVLTNCHTCLYESQVNSFFNSSPPSLEDYLSS